MPACLMFLCRSMSSQIYITFKMIPRPVIYPPRSHALPRYLLGQHVQNELVRDERDRRAGRDPNGVRNASLEEPPPPLVPENPSYAIRHSRVFAVRDDDFSGGFGYLDYLGSLLETRFYYLEGIGRRARDAAHVIYDGGLSWFVVGFEMYIGLGSSENPWGDIHIKASKGACILERKRAIATRVFTYNFDAAPMTR